MALALWRAMRLERGPGTSRGGWTDAIGWKAPGMADGGALGPAGGRRDVVGVVGVAGQACTQAGGGTCHTGLVWLGTALGTDSRATPPSVRRSLPCELMGTQAPVAACNRPPGWGCAYGARIRPADACPRSSARVGQRGWKGQVCPATGFAADSGQLGHSPQRMRAPLASISTPPLRWPPPKFLEGRSPVVEQTCRSMNPPGPVPVLDHPGIGARPVPVHASAAAHARDSVHSGWSGWTPRAAPDSRHRSSRAIPQESRPPPPWHPMGHPSPDPSPSPSVALAPPAKGHQQACSHPHQQACAVTTFASHLAMRGVPLKAVQELMGHATIDMTMRYAHLSPNVKKDAVRALDVVRPRGTLGAHRPGGRRPEMKKPPSLKDLEALSGCPGRDSNPHTFRRHPLKMVCLPVPPPGRFRCGFDCLLRTGDDGASSTTNRAVFNNDF